MNEPLEKRPTRSRLASNIFVLIRRDNMTQGMVARAMGVRQATVSDWVRGAVEPEQYNVKKLAELFGVTERDLRHEDLSTRRWTWADQSPPKDAEEAVRRARGVSIRLEGDMHDWGATEEDFAAVRRILTIDQTIELLRRPFESEEQLEQVFLDYVRFVEAMRLAIRDRLSFLRS